MCGITGVYNFNGEGITFCNQVNLANQAMINRGPDHQGFFESKSVALGHVRLSIIDTSASAHQPFTEKNLRYTIVFNGEIFNFKSIRGELEKKGHSFYTNSDTEVVLKSYIEYGKNCMEKFNGFFAFAIFDNQSDELFVARDRMGIKPFLFYYDDERFVFASEIKALLQYQIPKKIDYTTLYQYFQLNYIPSPWSIFKGVTKMPAGSWMKISKSGIDKGTYYNMPKYSETNAPKNYEIAKKELYKLLDEAVERRLIADVPLGSFLSGGIDSSIVSAIAAKHTSNLSTFSIGYTDEPMFDETHYAELVAKKIGTNHHVFKLTNDDLYSVLHRVLDYIDEPFADSSALAVNILSYYTKKHVTVALSGDGADEMFSGYNKHSAELKARKSSLANQLVKMGNPIWKSMPQSRNGKFTNFFRQLDRFSEGLKLSPSERYWLWASITNEKDALELLKQPIDTLIYQSRKNEILANISDNGSFNDVLYTDLQLVLQGDMLTKVDLMSMDHALEIRTPFLDFNVVNFANSLPVEFKIDSKIRKKILQDTFKSILPVELFNRPKHGFEVPLLGWFRNELKNIICNDLLKPEWIIEQGIFNPEYVKQLLVKLYSNNPGDSAAKVWALIVFQNWWKKYFL